MMKYDVEAFPIIFLFIKAFQFTAEGLQDSVILETQFKYLLSYIQLNLWCLHRV